MTERDGKDLLINEIVEGLMAVEMHESLIGKYKEKKFNLCNRLYELAVKKYSKKNEIEFIKVRQDIKFLSQEIKEVKRVAVETAEKTARLFGRLTGNPDMDARDVYSLLAAVDYLKAGLKP